MTVVDDVTLDIMTSVLLWGLVLAVRSAGITWYPCMIPLWVSGGGGSQLNLMVLFWSWFTVMDTTDGGALGTEQEEFTINSIALLMNT